MNDSAKRLVYKIHGLHVRSEIPLEAPVWHCANPDLEVFWGSDRLVPHDPPSGEVLQEHIFDDGRGFACSRSCSGYTIRLYGHCDFQVDLKLRTVRVYSDPSIDSRWVALFLNGCVLSMMLILSGKCVLHASAVELDGEGLAFVAGSGMGKSTLATMFCLSGWRLITDDVLRVDFVPDYFRCFPSAVGTRLRPNAASLAEAFYLDARSETVDERIHINLDHDFRRQPVLRAIVVPRLSRLAKRPRVQQLGFRDALTTLSRYPRILGLEDKDLIKTQFESFARLARYVPILEAEIPWSRKLSLELPAKLSALLPISWGKRGADNHSPDA